MDVSPRDSLAENLIYFFPVSNPHTSLGNMRPEDLLCLVRGRQSPQISCRNGVSIRCSKSGHVPPSHGQCDPLVLLDCVFQSALTAFARRNGELPSGNYYDLLDSHEVVNTIDVAVDSILDGSSVG